MKRFIVILVGGVLLASPSAHSKQSCIGGGDQCPAPQDDQLEKCQNSCMSGYMLVAGMCALLLPPANAICHAGNSLDLAQCLRSCRD